MSEKEIKTTIWSQPCKKLPYQLKPSRMFAKESLSKALALMIIPACDTLAIVVFWNIKQAISNSRKMGEKA